MMGGKEVGKRKGKATGWVGKWEHKAGAGKRETCPGLGTATGANPSCESFHYTMSEEQAGIISRSNDNQTLCVAMNVIAGWNC